jgi:hypothetical protein
MLDFPCYIEITFEIISAVTEIMKKNILVIEAILAAPDASATFEKSKDLLKK